MNNFLKTYQSRLLLVLFVAVALNIIALVIFDMPLRNEVCPNGIVSYELAKDLEQSTAILNSWDAHAQINAGLSLGFDFLFPLVYASLLALLIFSTNNRLWEQHRFHTVGHWLSIIALCAAGFDYVENIALIQLLQGNLEQIWSSTAYYFAVIKFAIVLISIAYILVNWGLLIVRSLVGK